MLHHGTIEKVARSIQDFDVVLGDKRFNACHVVIIHTIHIDEIVGKAPWNNSEQ
jgi:hypothetical protein